MNDQQINTAIAEACGWVKNVLGGWLNPEEADFRKYKKLPDYCRDLNMMHEAEKVLLKMDNSCAYLETYSNKLTTLLGCTDIFHVTARDRAETFLKTIGKWKD